MRRHRFEIQSTWHGDVLQPDEFARVDLGLPDRGPVEVGIEATCYGDPAPPNPAGRTDALWNYEVVELFLLGGQEHYLELEFGPHGHFLALLFDGRRRLARSEIEIDFEITSRADRWCGSARIDPDLLPQGMWAANCYAIHGSAQDRRYLAMQSVPGETPDFHRLEYFRPL